MSDALTEASRILDSAVRHVLAIGANVLPRRLWTEWEGRLPVARMATASALLTFFLGFGVGIPGFLRYAAGASGAITNAMLQAGYAEIAHKAAPGASAGAYGLSIFSLAAFAFFTPTGLLATYLVSTGLYRLLAVAAHEPRSDPLLALLDGGARRVLWKVALGRVVADRERREGEAVPDVLLKGKDLGVPQADFLVISSRWKTGWEPGVVVVTAEKRYRILPAFDRRLAEGLRRIYPLAELPAAEVMRRSIAYELPRLSAYDPVKRTTTLVAEESPPQTEG